MTEISPGTTLIEGTTWYEHRIWPRSYWRLCSDVVIHRIHMQALEHIKAISEEEEEEEKRKEVRPFGEYLFVRTLGKIRKKNDDYNQCPSSLCCDEPVGGGSAGFLRSRVLSKGRADGISFGTK